MELNENHNISPIKCYICMNVLHKPIKLPCSHVFCLECLIKAFEVANIQCPLCRYRLSNWKRKHKDLNKLIDNKIETGIQNIIPEFCKRRNIEPNTLPNEEEEEKIRLTENEFLPPSSISNGNGDLKREYENLLDQFTKKRIEEDKENEKASLELASFILAEDEMNIEDQIKILRELKHGPNISNDSIYNLESEPSIPLHDSGIRCLNEKKYPKKSNAQNKSSKLKRNRSILDFYNLTTNKKIREF